MLKAATVTPLLKKPFVNCEDMKNYRPISNLPYILKLIEKVVVKCFSDHMSQYHCYEYFQLHYRQYHSMQTGILRVHNDICQAIDGIEHSVLLRRFDDTLGISASVLNWSRPIVTGRNQSVNILVTASVPRPLTNGTPQGSVMQSFEFPSYTGPVGRIYQKHVSAYHFYADDMQLFLAFHPTDGAEAKDQLQDCINEICQWMKRNFLKLNVSKTVLDHGKQKSTAKP